MTQITIQPLPLQPGQTPVPLQRRHFLRGAAGSMPSPLHREQSPVPLQLLHFTAFFSLLLVISDPVKLVAGYSLLVADQIVATLDYS